MKKKTAPSKPRIGIWWDDGKTLRAITHSPLKNASGGLLLDSNLQHVKEWPTQAKYFGRSAHDGYESVPRGRVIFNTKTNQGIIYHGNATTQERLKRIAARFQLKVWKADRDPHYAFGEEIDRVFEDDE